MNRADGIFARLSIYFKAVRERDKILGCALFGVWAAIMGVAPGVTNRLGCSSLSTKASQLQPPLFLILKLPSIKGGIGLLESESSCPRGTCRSGFLSQRCELSQLRTETIQNRTGLPLQPAVACDAWVCIVAVPFPMGH